MTLETARGFFLWCFLINYAILLWWFAWYACAGDWMHRFHGKWFPMSKEQYGLIHYSGMALYKIGIFLFCFVPWVALWIVG